jgi:hypothetical protein
MYVLVHNIHTFTSEEDWLWVLSYKKEVSCLSSFKTFFFLFLTVHHFPSLHYGLYLLSKGTNCCSKLYYALLDQLHLRVIEEKHSNLHEWY